MGPFRAPISLLARTTIALLVVAVVPLGVAIWSLFDVNREGLREQVLRTHALAAASAAARIAAAVDMRVATARNLASDPRITDDPRGRDAQRFLQQVLLGDPSIDAVVVTTPSNELVVRVQQRGVALFPTGPSLAPRLEGSMLRTSALFADGRGVVHVFADGSAIVNALDTAEIGEDAQMTLASATEIVAGSRTEITPDALLAAAKAARELGTSIDRDRAGKEVMAAFATVAGTEWFVFSRQPAALAERLTGSMRRRAALAAALALLLAGAIVIAARQTVVEPIHEIVRAQQKLAGASPDTAGNEIDQLRESADLVQRRIDDQEDLGRVFLGRYQVLELIGQGGMGTVFRGWDPKLRRSVALKTVHHKDVSSLVAEAVTVASMNHPNIVSVYDADESTGAAFIAMELIDGMSLDSYLEAYGPVRPEDALVLGLAVARALAAAHARGFLHRDIKPANVLLGNDDTIKVADFGLARIGSHSPRAEGIHGTPGYMAPEAIDGKPCDGRSDLFSLGVTLYEAVTGEHPFVRAGMRETFSATMLVNVPPLVDILPLTGPLILLSEITTSLLGKCADDRPSSAMLLAERLETIVRYHGLEWRMAANRDAENVVPLRRSASARPTVVTD